MRFWTGVLLGLLVAGPTVEHHYYVTETTNVGLNRQTGPTAPASSHLQWGDAEGEEGCVVELLGGSGAAWTAEDVLAVLDEAWTHHDGPCDMLAAR